MTFGGEVPEGAIVRITRSSRESVIEATNTSVKQALEAYPGSKPAVAICFSCAGRKQVLGTRTKEEYELLHEHYPDLQIAGFYGYGEIGPLHQDEPARFHNETFVSLLLGPE